MRSRADCAAFLLLLLLGLATPAWPADDVFTAQEVDQAIERVKGDPNLLPERKERRLVWDDAGGDEPEPADWIEWLKDLFTWLAGISQMLMWLLVAGLVAALAIVLVRLFGGRTITEKQTTGALPTHVRDLDIRPESLPADIGAAARRLWERGEHRAALALLYRGLLSRLAHSFAVPIRDSSTEGDCVALAARTLAGARLEYVRRLVRSWQIATYAGRHLDDALVFELCAEFDAQLSAPMTEAAA